MKKPIKRLIRPSNSYFPYSDRKSRSEFISKYFRKYLRISILDVGSSQNYLKKYISEDILYASVDIAGNPTYKIDLEKEALSKFDDNSYFTVICTEVLEHLNNLHDVFDDLCRVSQKYLIISLPNNWINFKFMLMSNKGAPKFYGLPIEKPFDRHKWFFNYDDALNFILKRGKKNNFYYKFHFPVPFIHFSIKDRILNIFFKFYYKNQFGFNNLNYSYLWILLEKKN